MKLTRLTAPRPTEATIEVLGEPITLTYDRAAIDGKLFGMETMREKIASVLLDWDVTNEDGSPYAPDPALNGARAAAWLALFEPLADDVIAAIYRGILTDFYAGNPAGGDSSAS